MSPYVFHQLANIQNLVKLSDDSHHILYIYIYMSVLYNYFNTKEQIIRNPNHPRNLQYFRSHNN